MGLFSGPKPAKRDFGSYPEIPPNSQAGSLSASFSSSAAPTTDSGSRKVAVGSAVRLLAGLTSSLPCAGFTGEGAARREVPLPGFFTDPDGSGQGFGDWIEQVFWSAALRGNVVAHVLARDSMMRPAQLLLKHPDMVSVREGQSGPEWRFNGKLVPTEDVWHRRVHPVPGQRLGMSVIAQHAMTVLQGNAAAAFGLRWFLDGAHPSAILRNNDARKINQPDAEGVKARFMAAVRGSREPVVFGAGWEYTPIQVRADESQFLETQQYTAAECARIFGPGIAEILGYETGGSHTYANVEQRSIDLLRFTLNPWLNRFEEWLSQDLLPAPRKVKFNRGALLETDLLTRYRAHEIGIRAKFLVPNEVRALEDRPPVAWGDEPVEPAGKSPQELAGELVQKLYLGVGKVLTVDEARAIIRDAGIDLDAVDLDELFANLPPAAAGNLKEII